MAEVNTSNIGFEKQIWEAACVLRGNIDASEYKTELQSMSQFAGTDFLKIYF